MFLMPKITIELWESQIVALKGMIKYYGLHTKEQVATEVIAQAIRDYERTFEPPDRDGR
jgi:hypothetical protein